MIMKNRILKVLSVAIAGMLLTGCYSDFENPSPAEDMTRAGMEAKGLTYMSVKDVKQMFYDAKGQPATVDGTVVSMTVTQPIYTCGKVISSDRDGNIYKSLYIYDQESKSAIELRLNVGNYIAHPVGQIVYVKLQNLVIGNYRGMLSVGRKSMNPEYSNDNIEDDITLRQHIFSGERQPMLPSDTLVVNSTNYTTGISDADLGRLVRFEGVTSKFGHAEWGYKNNFPNYFWNSSHNYDVTSAGWEDIYEWATWATKRKVPTSDTNPTLVQGSFYGSAWFTYGDINNTPGNYVVRTSAYSNFAAKRIPDNGSVVTLTAIYAKFTSGRGDNTAYQLTLNSDRDVIVK